MQLNKAKVIGVLFVQNKNLCDNLYIVFGLRSLESINVITEIIGPKMLFQSLLLIYK